MSGKITDTGWLARDQNLPGSNFFFLDQISYQATRGCAARLSRLRRLLVRAKPNNTASYAGYQSMKSLNWPSIV